MGRSEHAGYAVSKIVAGQMNGTNIERLGDPGNIIGVGLERDPFAGTCTFPGPAKVDADHSIPLRSERCGHGVKVTYGQGPTRKQHNGFAFALTEILNG